MRYMVDITDFSSAYYIWDYLDDCEFVGIYIDPRRLNTECDSDHIIAIL